MVLYNETYQMVNIEKPSDRESELNFLKELQRQHNESGSPALPEPERKPTETTALVLAACSCSQPEGRSECKIHTPGSKKRALIPTALHAAQKDHFVIEFKLEGGKKSRTEAISIADFPPERLQRYLDDGLMKDKRKKKERLILNLPPIDTHEKPQAV